MKRNITDHVPGKETGVLPAAESGMKGVPERELIDKYTIFSPETGFFYGKMSGCREQSFGIGMNDNLLIVCMSIVYIL